MDVERFLTSCDSPFYSVVQTLTEHESNATTAEPDLRVKIKPIFQMGKQIANSKVDLLAKREIERAKDRKRRNAYRERRRVEREMLQRQVKDLSDKLCRMEKARDASCSSSTAAWKAVAKQQYDALQIAELQQQRLKMVVHSRVRLIQEFSRFVHERIGRNEIQQEKLNVDDISGSCQHKRVRIGSSDTEIFETYLQGLDVVYAQADQVFQAFKMGSVSPKPPPTWTFDRRTGFFEFVDRYVAAFNFKLASQLLWQLSNLLHRQEDRKLYEDLKVPSNTVAFKFRITSRMNCGQCVSVVQSSVGRRYMEKDRLVVVWRSFTEGEGLFRGLHSDETGWCIVKPSPISAKASTSLDICIRHVPMHFGSAKEDEAAMEQFTNLLRTTGSEDIFEITSSLMNTNFQDSEDLPIQFHPKAALEIRASFQCTDVRRSV